MQNTYPQCPKCGYRPPQPLPGNATCPACGIYFFKWEQIQSPHEAALPNPPGETASSTWRDYPVALLKPPQLILLGGHTGDDGPHDWIYLLTRIVQLDHAQHWGMVVHTLGGILTLVSLVWAMAILWRQHRNSSE